MVHAAHLRTHPCRSSLCFKKKRAGRVERQVDSAEDQSERKEISGSGSDHAKLYRIRPSAGLKNFRFNKDDSAVERNYRRKDE